MDIDLSILRMLEREKEISFDVLVEAIEQALLTAYHKTPGAVESARVQLDRKSGHVTVFAAEVNDEGEKVGEYDDTPDGFGRIAATTAKQIMLQRFRDAEDDLRYGEFSGKEGDIVSGIIQQGRNPDDVMVDLGKLEALLPSGERVPGEDYSHGTRIKCLVVSVRKGMRGPQVMLSRTHPNLVKKLFALEVPEIHDGTVEISAIAREAGHRTKIAVWSNDHNVDPVGACVGARGGRVRMVVNELRGEKIDIVPFSEDLADFVAKALSPAKVSQVIISEDGTQADVIVPDHQLSLAIGREGQNARLSARLTGVRVDIRSETQLAEGIPAGGRDVEVEYADGEWIANAETGEMEWHAADGSVVSESDWQAQTETPDAETEADTDAVADVLVDEVVADEIVADEVVAEDQSGELTDADIVDDTVEEIVADGEAADEDDDA